MYVLVLYTNFYRVANTEKTPHKQKTLQLYRT
jgi:hypothetical protein